MYLRDLVRSEGSVKRLPLFHAVMGVLPLACGHGDPAPVGGASILDARSSMTAGVADPGPPISPWSGVNFPHTSSTPEGLRMMLAPLAYAQGERIVVDQLGGFAVVGLSAQADAATLNVTRFDESTSLLWQRAFFCAGSIRPVVPTLMDGAGNTFVAGGFSGNCNFGEEDVQSTVNPTTDEAWPEVSGSEFDDLRGVPSMDWFVLGLDDSGDVSRMFIHGAGEQFASALYLGARGEVHALGEFEGSIDVAGKEFTSSLGARAEALLVELASAESPGAVGQLSLSGVYSAGETPAGELVVAGAGQLPLLVGEGTAGRALGWVVSLGEEEASWALAWDPPLAPTELEVDGEGNTYLLLAGPQPEFVDLSALPDPVESAAEGIVLLKVSPSGSVLWERRATGTLLNAALALSDDQVAVIGSFRDALQFGEDSFDAGVPTAFAWFLNTEGQDDYAVSIGSGIHNRGLDIVANPAGGWLTLWWAGDLYPSLRVGPGYHAMWFRDFD